MSSETITGSGLINYSFDTARNVRVALLDPRLKDADPSAGQSDYARTAPLIHATSLDTLEALDASGELLPLATLQERGMADDFDRMRLLTDKFDQELGLDNFTFWGLGRAKSNPAQFQAFLTLTDPSYAANSLVSFEDIADMGAIVSDEHAEQIQFGLDVDERYVTDRNRKTARKYFRSLMRGQDFSEVFARYLATNHPSRTDYLTATYFPYRQQLPEDDFPWIDATTGKAAEMREAWGGPQVLLGGVALDRVDKIFVFDFPATAEVRQRVGQLGLADRVEYISDYMPGLTADPEFLMLGSKEHERYGAGVSYHTVINNVINRVIAEQSW